MAPSHVDPAMASVMNTRRKDESRNTFGVAINKPIGESLSKTDHSATGPTSPDTIIGQDHAGSGVTLSEKLKKVGQDIQGKIRTGGPAPTSGVDARRGSA
ncbi:hypothetical protein HDV00_006880 [Rhizophlyctis rosea]|nr:hypothetical protein HDV00_006880 [Rhizophlyctis rosea]